MILCFGRESHFSENASHCVALDKMAKMAGNHWHVLRLWLMAKITDFQKVLWLKTRKEKKPEDSNLDRKAAHSKSDKTISPVSSQFDPDDVSVFGFLSGTAVVAEPAPIRHCDVEAVRVEGCRTRLTAQELASCNTTNQ